MRTHPVRRAGFIVIAEMASSAGAGEARVVLQRKLGVPVGWLRGTVLYERWWGRLRSVDLAAVWRVRLLPNRVGGMYLDAEDGEGRRAGCHVLVIGLNSERHLSPDALDRLVAALELSTAPSAEGVCRRLQEQAEHLRSGRGIWSSPLRTPSEWLPGGVGSRQPETGAPRPRDPFK